MALSIILHLVANFFAGLFFCNSIPHLVSGLCGQPFPTPFASPPGRGMSSSVVNFVWGFLNLVIALVLMCLYRVEISFNTGLLLFLLAFFLVGLFSAAHFGRVRAGRG